MHKGSHSLPKPQSPCVGHSGGNLSEGTVSESSAGALPPPPYLQLKCPESLRGFNTQELIGRTPLLLGRGILCNPYNSK